MQYYTALLNSKELL